MFAHFILNQLSLRCYRIIKITLLRTVQQFSYNSIQNL